MILILQPFLGMNGAVVEHFQTNGGCWNTMINGGMWEIGRQKDKFP